uniref:VAN3-binding protein-like auxin canalisation domain-containing protein n=1 Tax=Oryza rufipogon TaxID=4529 RepID=A0A0E0N6R7_ORYRU
MAVAMAKLLITGLSTAITCSSAVAFKGAAVAVVLLLRLVQLPGQLGCLLLCAIREAVERAVATAFAAAGDAVAAAADAAAGAWRDAAASNGTAVVALVQAAMGRPEALLAAAGEVAAFAWEVAKQTASNSTATFLDAALFVARHARAFTYKNPSRLRLCKTLRSASLLSSSLLPAAAAAVGPGWFRLDWSKTAI